jgi:CelD/BcsL family acetyltransferase involved in cellulose biosynthesis
VGYQYQGVFHYAELGYDPALAPASPGTVLLFLLIQDLCAFDRPMVLNFGMGDAEYKRRFGNRHQTDDTLLLVKPTMRNRGALLTHRAFRRMVKIVRGMVKGRTPTAPDASAALDQ